MRIAARVKWFLDTHKIHYEVIHHPHSSSSDQTARSAHIPRDRLAKCVLLEDERGYLLAVLPTSRRIDLGGLERMLHRKLELASESELSRLFSDCETGAVPPFGSAYGIPAVVDDSLIHLSDIYCEAGTHEEVLHMEGESFKSLLSGARHAIFSRPN